jgi:tetratricopeptide (TPR) repeat protein
MRGTSFACTLTAIAFLAPLALGQSPEAEGPAVVQGTIRDAHSSPLPAAAVSLLLDAPGHALIAHTDAQGSYRFSALHGGRYTLRAEMAGYAEAAFGPFVLGAKETKQVDLTLAPAPTAAGAAEFFDEPSFIVAGVVDTNNRGGHGSDTVVRSAETLARAAASLSKEPGAAGPAVPPATENSLREAVEREPANAELHHSLADVEERRGNALEAVREYQRAAELNANETNLFDWGTELLTHRAAEQAMVVFAKGNRLFPRSVRMLLGLGAASYARGSYEEAAQRFFEAADLNPSDPGPYLFLGKVQGAEIGQMDGFVERLARFARLQPDNALANYYYATSLWNRWKGLEDRQTTVQVQSLLAKAVRLDPALADAWLQLGIVYSGLMDFSNAISAYQEAIEAGTRLQEVHYRLGQALQQTGERLKARKEFDLYEQLRETSAAEVERERSGIQQFVFALRDRPSAAPPRPAQ